MVFYVQALSFGTWHSVDVSTPPREYWQRQRQPDLDTEHVYDSKKEKEGFRTRRTRYAMTVRCSGFGKEIPGPGDCRRVDVEMDQKPSL